MSCEAEVRDFLDISTSSLGVLRAKAGLSTPDGPTQYLIERVADDNTDDWTEIVVRLIFENVRS